MATYYFSSSTGNDSTGLGTINSPWANFSAKKAGTNALSPGDICLFKAGDTWVNQEIIVDSNGTSGSRITLDRYGSGNDPIFQYSSVITNWTYTGANGIYYKAGQYLYNGTVGIDGTSALYNQTYTNGKTNSNIDAGCYFNNNGTLYIRLADGSDPAGHTIYVPTQGRSDANRGVIRGSYAKGSYVDFNHFKVIFCQGVGFSVSQPYSYFNDCTAIGCGGDGFLLEGFTPTGEMASYSRCYRCYASYCVAGGVGHGQAFTSGADHAWFINCTAEYNFAAGFDFLNGLTPQNTTYADCRHGGAVYCTAYKNGQAPSEASMYDAGIYIDGAHDILIYGCVSHGAGIGGQVGRDAANIAVRTEHAVYPLYNIHLVNNLCYDAQSYNIYFDKGGDWPYYNNAAPAYGNTIVNNTCIRGSGGYGGSFFGSGFGTSVKTIIKNNIFMRTAGSYLDLMWAGGLTGTVVDMDYNIYYDPNNTNIIATGESSPAYNLTSWIAYTTVNGGTLDSHSIQANPTLVSTTFATLDAHLQTGSPGVNTGLSSPWTPPQWVIDAAVLADNGAVVGTTRSDGVVDSGTLDIGYHYYAPTPYGNLTATNVEPATLYLNTANNVTVTFTTANAIPSDGKIEITFPTALGGGFTFNSGGTTAASFNSGGSGSLAVSSVGSIMTLTRSGGSTIAAGQAVSINLTHILNPPVAGSTGAYQIRTTTSTGTSIDIDTAVSADQIISAAAGFVTITISGISMANIKINNG